MKIRVLYWPYLGSQAAVLGNVRGFQHFGDVEFIAMSTGGGPTVRERDISSGADLVFIPDFSIVLSSVPHLFAVLQFGGRGPAQLWRLGAFNGLHRVSDSVELITILDTNLHQWLTTKKQPWRWDTFHLVPNGLHYDLFQYPPKEPEKELFTVLAPKIGAPAKTGASFANVAHIVHNKGYRNIRFVAPVQNVTHYLVSRDIIPIEPVLFYKMPKLYQMCDVVLNIPPEEVLPNSAFEAFLSAKPFIVLNDGLSTCIGDIQTVATQYIDKMKTDFGTSVESFHDKWADKFWTGDHFLAGKSYTEVAEIIIDLYEHPDLKEKVGAKAREWSLSLNWTWEDKCKLILDLCREQGWWG